MMIRGFQSLVAAVLILTAVGAAKANYPYACGRWIGIGWSDGYHSQYGCPPRGHAARQGGAGIVELPAPAPWWMSPANGAEQLPTPAGSPGNGQPMNQPPADGSSIVRPGMIRR